MSINERKEQQLAKLVAEWGREFRERWNASDEETHSKPTQYYYDMLDMLHENIREQYADLTKEDWLEVATLVSEQIPADFWDGKNY